MRLFSRHPDQLINRPCHDFVYNLYKVIASKVGYLEANWNKVKRFTIQVRGKEVLLTAEMAVTASHVG